MNTRTSLTEVLARGSEGFRRLNGIQGNAQAAPSAPRPDNSLRQSTKPALNKLESAFVDELHRMYPSALSIEPHAITFRIANGCRYTPDMIVDLGTDHQAYGHSTRLIAFEVKGKKFWDDAIVKLKVTASQFPAVEFWLARRDKNAWKHQRILA